MCFCREIFFWVYQKIQLKNAFELDIKNLKRILLEYSDERYRIIVQFYVFTN
jgi:hypothetical protein